MVYPLQIQDQHFELHPAGVLFWKEQKLLLVSDVHLGKVSHFRKYGAAIPRKAIASNYSLLDSCLRYYQPDTLCFLGDLFHSHLNAEWQLFEGWAAQRTIPILLIAGNHDIISPLKYENLGIRVLPEVCIGNFLLTHEPEERDGYFTIAGHIHPAIRLHGKGRQKLRLPCFYKVPSQLILPAFGTFTGMFTMEKNEGSEVFAIADRQVIKI